MNKTLIILILAVIVLSWNFIFTEKKVGLTDQAWVLQGLSSALAHKLAIAKYWSEKGSLPDNAEWIKEKPAITVDLSQTIVESIEVGVDGPGVISVRYTTRPDLASPAQIDGRKINLVPVVLNGKLDWTCKGTLDITLMPRNCSTMAEK